jgi:hypothetical protein
MVSTWGVSVGGMASTGALVGEVLHAPINKANKPSKEIIASREQSERNADDGFMP